MKMKNCKTCGANMAKKAKICPQCGAKNKKPPMETSVGLDANFYYRCSGNWK